ncbi:3-carboxy-cis,cis-muconate cycloisomerase [Streptomyces sp. NPDC050560]|uniref:3-carboxy-cis,cis-muconate cycloisomerase n=1 Tax=Streptomyces sp. NPDC050560 TaxID=3365630 RepID=UPI003799DC3F
MSLGDTQDPAGGAGGDVALLAPGIAGTAAEAATSDTAVLGALLAAEAALTRAAATAGLAPAAAADTVAAAAARPAAFDARGIALRARAGGNPVIPLVGDLREAVGAEHAPHVHHGATSQDILDSALMLLAAGVLDTLAADLERAAGHLGRLAAAHRDTVLPGRTLTQHAVPTTFGLKAAGWRSLLLDARDRVRTVRAALPAQLGGAAGTLAAFLEQADGREEPVRALSEAYARELGLAAAPLPWHTLRTPLGDLAGALAFTAGALGKLAADVLLLSRTETAEVAEGAGGGSSTMPHKSNPVRATLIATAARRAPQSAAVLYGAMAAEDERPAGAWHAEWEPLRDLLRTVGGAAEAAVGLTGSLRVDAAAMRTHLGLTRGLIVSERLTAALAPVLGAYRARALLTRAAATARETGRPLADVLAELLSDAPGAAGLDLAALTEPDRYTGLAGPLTDRALKRP